MLLVELSSKMLHKANVVKMTRLSRHREVDEEREIWCRLLSLRRVYAIKYIHTLSLSQEYATEYIRVQGVDPAPQKKKLRKRVHG